MLVLEGRGAAADAAAFRATGIGDFDVFDFERQAKRPDGSTVKVAFSLAFAADAKAPDTGYFTCQQHYPENFWNPAFQAHPNGVTGIAGVILVSEKPEDHRHFLGAFSSVGEVMSTASGISVRTERGEIQVMNPSAYRAYAGTEPPKLTRGARLAAIRFMAGDKAKAMSTLKKGDIAVVERDGNIVVPPDTSRWRNPHIRNVQSGLIRLAQPGMVGQENKENALNDKTSAAAIVPVGSVKFGNDLPISIIAGPCQLESRAHALEVASALKEIAARLKIGLVYKTSFDKANRTSVSAARGIGLAQALPIFAEIRSSLGLPVLTDVHEAAQCAEVAQAVDVLQIPAFLCRQTDLLLAAAATGKVVNVKKGQFLAPWDMANVVAKITGAGNRDVLVTERGASFGYNTLVSDMRALPILARTTGAPVIFDATHSVQQPGGKGTSSGGEREFVPVLARAAVAVGVAGVFIETHPDPDHAPSDGPNMVPLREFEDLVKTLMAFDALAKNVAR